MHRLHAPASLCLAPAGGSEDAETELGASGDLAGDDVRVYSRELFDAECLAATCLAQLLGQDTPLFKS